MNVTDERFDRFKRLMPSSDDMTLVTLKGHLLAEEMLDEIIRSRCRAPSVLDEVNLSFFIKSRLARALVGPPFNNNKAWEMLDALNELRNDLAHKLESTKFQARVDKLHKTVGFLTIDASVKPGRAVKMSISFLLGRLSAVESTHLKLCEIADGKA